MLISRTSPITGQRVERDIPVDPEDYVQWKLGAYIQDVMPYLSAGDREFILTGITEEEWDRMFAPSESDVEMSEGD